MEVLSGKLGSFNLLSYATALDVVAVGLFLYGLRKVASRQPTAAPLPPGPKRLPLLGNLLDMPSSQEWLTFADWGKKHGTSRALLADRVANLQAHQAILPLSPSLASCISS